MSRTFSFVLLLAAALTGPAIGQNLGPECIAPPGNNPIADTIVAVVDAIRPLFYTGLPDYNIPVLDPLGPLPPIAINISSATLSAIGHVEQSWVLSLGQYFQCQLNVSLGLTQKFDIVTMMPNLSIHGLYDVNGVAAAIIPFFGNGNYSIDITDAGFQGDAKIDYNILHDRLQIKDLQLDIFYSAITNHFENIMGGGELGEAIDQYVSELATEVVYSVWSNIAPILEDGLQSAINDALYNVSITGPMAAPAPLLETKELGNANFFMNMVTKKTAKYIKDNGLEPAPLPDTVLDLGNLIKADLVNGTLAGLSTIHRSGTSTVDTVADWIFLYTNVAVGPLTAVYRGVVTDTDGTTDTFEATASVDIVDVYVTARGDVLNYVLDIDQFVITELGHANVEIRGLGLLGRLSGVLTEAITNLFLDDIQAILATQIKDALQAILNETPWPPA